MESGEGCSRRATPSLGSERMAVYIVNKSTQFCLIELESPDRFVVISHCCFDDNYYSTRNLAPVVSPGNWKRCMTPLSLLGIYSDGNWIGPDFGRADVAA